MLGGKMTLRIVAVCCALVGLAACGTPKPLPRDVPPIGDFRLGYNIVLADGVTKSVGSRDATEDELTGAVRSAMEDRLGRYDGNGLYHIGLRIEGYSLGVVGVPILFSPRSVLLIAMNVWDDATQEKLTEEPVRITAFEGEAGPLMGSGLVKRKNDQLLALAFDAALEIEQYLQANEAAWFPLRPGRERVEFVRDPRTGRQRVVPEAGETTPDPGTGALAEPAAQPALPQATADPGLIPQN